MNCVSQTMSVQKKLRRPKFSKRMEKFVELALPDVDFWDICCDHGYVGILGLRSEKFTKVYFVDSVPHIMNRLEQLFLESPNTPSPERFELMTVNGELITREIYGNLLVAGVSGTTVVKILSSLFHRQCLFAKRLILSPHSDLQWVKDLFQEGFGELASKYCFTQLIEVEEGGRMRPILICDRCE